MKAKDFDSEKLKESGQVFMAQLAEMSKKLRMHMENVSGTDAEKLGITHQDVVNKVNSLNGELSKLSDKLKSL